MKLATIHGDDKNMEVATGEFGRVVLTMGNSDESMQISFDVDTATVLRDTLTTAIKRVNK